MSKIGKRIKNARLETLGYSLHVHCIDAFGIKWRWGTFPMGSGPTNYFDSITGVDTYCAQVEQIRSWQQ